jgi:hypothetical protein
MADFDDTWILIYSSSSLLNMHSSVDSEPVDSGLITKGSRNQPSRQSRVVIESIVNNSADAKGMSFQDRRTLINQRHHRLSRTCNSFLPLCPNPPNPRRDVRSWMSHGEISGSKRMMNGTMFWTGICACLAYGERSRRRYGQIRMTSSDLYRIQSCPCGACGSLVLSRSSLIHLHSN